MLEGYRMGRSANGKNIDYDGKGNSSKGGGKGARAGMGPAIAPVNRTCQREGCRAAASKQATWGGVAKCHCCGLSLTATLPVEQLVDWAFKLRLEEQATKATSPAAPQANGAASPTSAASAKATVANGQPTSEQLAAKRVERLAALKTAGTTPPTQPTALEEVTKVFVETQVKKKPLEVPDVFEKGLQDLSEQASALIDSLKTESFPWDTPLETPEAILNKELSAVSAGHSVASQEAAEAALQGTKRSIAALDAPEGDPDLATLLRRKERQEKEVARLSGKKPTAKLQRLALEDIQGAYKKRVQAAVEGTERGESKAKHRAASRAETLDCMMAKLKDLQSYMADTHKELSARHNERAAAKAAQAAEVHALIEERLDAIVTQAEPDLPDEDMYDKTETEEARDAAQLKLLRANAGHAVAQSQQAQAWEAQLDLDQKTAQEAVQAAELQRDAEKDARTRVEERLAKLEDAFRIAQLKEVELVKRATVAEAKATATTAEAVAALATPPSSHGTDRHRSRSRSARDGDDKEVKEREAFGRKSKDASPDVLPPFDPSPEQVPVLADLFYAFKRWSAEGADLPITLQTLASQTALGEEAPLVVKMLLGEKVLKALAIDVAQEEQVIPRQAMTLLLHSLDKLRDKLAKGGKSAATAREEKALATMTAMRLAQKKRPAEGSDLPPAKQVAGSEAAVSAAAAADQAETDKL